ncbi:MAG TPA: protein kinase [Vicinamibacterales bacterium]|jgi:serine/threonine-protein kinase|nr:protein kinase [Vicinamibacterales bacterium]
MRASDKALWPALSPLLDRALELEPGARTELLASVRRDAPEVAAALERLLTEHERAVASAFLEAPPVVDGAPTVLAGQTVGAYTLVRPLGSGGMGTVWLAQRSDGRFEGNVAVKLVHLAVLDREGQERFRREGTLLARLAHPHIARLLDAGVTTGGQPFLVLEYVEGTRIDQYAADHRLSVEARLDFILQIADAVAHAHANLVVHRDIKPSNVLVDTGGSVKLLDFGIATIVDPASTGEPGAVTVPGARALTPEYASPEQVVGGPITTATDVYALGVLMYQLLLGDHPTKASGASYAEMLRALAEHEPARLSDAVAQRPADDPETRRILEERGTTRDRLRRACRGDLDTIVSTALKKNPSERYQGVGALADDIRRHLRNEPVSARPDRWAYRARKFVRRHRAGVAAATVVVATLIAAVGVTTREMITARRERDRADFQRRRAQASSEFMRNLVTQIGNKPMTMREVLDRGRVALEQQYEGDPAFIARMLVALSGPYRELGDLKTADEMMARALQLAEIQRDPELLATVHCDTGDQLIDERNFDAARRHLAEGEQYLRQAFSPETNAECAIAETSLAVAERRYDDAVRHASGAVTLLEQAGNTRSTRYTSALTNLAVTYSTVGRLQEALTAQRRVTEVSRQIGRAKTTAVVVSLQNEGGFLRRLGRWLEAERRFVEAIELARGGDRMGRVPSYLLVNRARLLVSLARGEEALALLQQARTQGQILPTFEALGKLAEALVRVDRGDVIAARALYDELQPGRTALPDAHAHGVTILGARLAQADGRLPEARALVDRAIEQSGFPRTLSPAQPELLELAARLSLDSSDLETAIRRCQDSLRVADTQFGRDGPNAYVGRAHLTLGVAFAAQGNAHDARNEWERAAAILEPSAGASHPWTVEARTRLAGTH